MGSLLEDVNRSRNICCCPSIDTNGIFPGCQENQYTILEILELEPKAKLGPDVSFLRLQLYRFFKKVISNLTQ